MEVKLYRELGIESLAELEAAAQAGRLKPVKGLGAALQIKILQNIEIGRSGAGRLHMHRAAALLENAQITLQKAHPELTRLAPAGDFRRGCELVAELAVVAQAPALETGQAVLRGGGALSVHLADKAHYGAELLFATGSQTHLEALQALARERGMTLTASGLKRGRKTIAVKSEAEIPRSSLNST